MELPWSGSYIPDDWRELDGSGTPPAGFGAGLSFTIDPIVAPKSRRFTVRGVLMIFKNGIDGIAYFFDLVGKALTRTSDGKTTSTGPG